MYIGGISCSLTLCHFSSQGPLSGLPLGKELQAWQLKCPGIHKSTYQVLRNPVRRRGWRWKLEMPSTVVLGNALHNCMQMHHSALPGSQILEVLLEVLWERKAASLPPCLLRVRSLDYCPFLVFRGLALGECCFLDLSFQCAESKEWTVAGPACWSTHTGKEQGVLLPFSIVSLTLTEALEPQTRLPNGRAPKKPCHPCPSGKAGAVPFQFLLPFMPSEIFVKH